MKKIHKTRNLISIFNITNYNMIRFVDYENLEFNSVNIFKYFRKKFFNISLISFDYDGNSNKSKIEFTLGIYDEDKNLIKPKSTTKKTKKISNTSVKKTSEKKKVQTKGKKKGKSKGKKGKKSISNKKPVEEIVIEENNSDTIMITQKLDGNMFVKNKKGMKEKKDFFQKKSRKRIVNWRKVSIFAHLFARKRAAK